MLVYLHGLNSSARSAKALRLATRLAPFKVCSPDYPAHRPEAAVKRLTHFFNSLDAPRPAVVGSSMGGFYAQYLARRFRFSHLFLINPALTPWVLMQEHLGETQTTAAGERYLITADLAESVRAYAIDAPCDKTPTTVFLDRGDEVIDYRIAERHYRGCARLMVWDGGDHAFQHMEEATEVIRAHLATQDPSRLAPNGETSQTADWISR